MLKRSKNPASVGRNIIYIVAFMLILFLHSAYSQNTFRLGFTGMYPSYYDFTNQSNINWNYYHDMNTNIWQGWWIGNNWDNLGNNGTNSTVQVMQNLFDENIDGYFQPDTIRWAALGRVQINYAASGRDDRFKFGSVSNLAQSYNDPLNGGKAVLYFARGDNPEPSTTVLSEVTENCMQSKNNNFDPMFQVDFPYNDYYHTPPIPAEPHKYLNNYYVKPRMRINVADAYGPNTEVVRVIVKKFNGDVDLADTVTIYTNDFKVQSGGSYDG